MSRPVCLDTFCGAGGAGVGYHRAGYRVVGVDIEPQPHYPFEFVQADAIEFIREHGSEYDLIHASPPCQAYSTTASLSNRRHPKLIESTRAALIATGKPYVIENVPGAPLTNPLVLCGTMFGLRVIRHHLFECLPILWWPPMVCNHWGKVAPIWWRDLPRGRTPGQSFFDHYDFITVCGKNFLACDIERAMGIDWMTVEEAAQAIPPAYTEFIGRAMSRYVRSNNRSSFINPEGDLDIGDLPTPPPSR